MRSRNASIRYRIGYDFFHVTGIFKTIVDSIGIVNGIECVNRRRIMREEQVCEILQALKDPSCMFPLVLIVSKRMEDGMMDEDWLGQFRVSDFTRTVWRYAHVFTCYEEVGRKYLEQAGLRWNAQSRSRGCTVFWPMAMWTITVLKCGKLQLWSSP